MLVAKTKSDDHYIRITSLSAAILPVLEWMVGYILGYVTHIYTHVPAYGGIHPLSSMHCTFCSMFTDLTVFISENFKDCSAKLFNVKHKKNIIFVFLRKISPELTSMPIFLYFIRGTPATAWLATPCHVHTQDLNQRTPGRRDVECANLTAVPPGQPLEKHNLSNSWKWYITGSLWFILTKKGVSSCGS